MTSDNLDYRRNLFEARKEDDSHLFSFWAKDWRITKITFLITNLGPGNGGHNHLKKGVKDMAKKRHTIESIVTKLREVEIIQRKGFIITTDLMDRLTVKHLTK